MQMYYQKYQILFRLERKSDVHFFIATMRSMAACFAGPSFNLLVGLSFGLLTQKESLMSADGLKVTLLPTVRTGFIFLLTNCIAAMASSLYHGGKIPKMHSYVFWAFYFAYLSMSAQHLM